MALSVLTIVPGREYGLWCSERKVFIDKGTQSQMYQDKDRMEGYQQTRANREWKHSVFTKQVDTLMAGGMTRQKAEEQARLSFSKDHPALNE